MIKINTLINSTEQRWTQQGKQAREILSMAHKFS